MVAILKARALDQTAELTVAVALIMGFNLIQITLIRHAPTAYNKNGIFMGDKDIPISDEGAEMAKKLSLTIGKQKYSNYFCSTLSRTIDTARLIFPDADIIAEEFLKERGIGEWTDKLKQKIRNVFPEAFLKSGLLNPFFTPPEGEPLVHFLERVSSFLIRIIDYGPNQNFLLVTHHGVIRAIRFFIERRPLIEVFSELEPALKPRVYEAVDISPQMIQKQITIITNTALKWSIDRK